MLDQVEQVIGYANILVNSAGVFGNGVLGFYAGAVTAVRGDSGVKP